MTLPSRYPAPGHPVATPPVETPEPARRATLLPWAIKFSLGLALAGLGAGQYLSHVADRAATQREARLRLADDPETTGSIASAAEEVRLDPCRVLSRLAGGR